MSRLATAVAVGGFIRLVEQHGGNAVVLARGDRDSGQVLLVVEPRDGGAQLWERGLDAGGRRVPVRVGPDDPAAVTDYWRRRRRSDPDLWVIEATVAGAERFAATTLFAD